MPVSYTHLRKADETWKPVYGERAEIRDCYNEMTLKFKKGEGDGAQEGGYDKRKNYFMNIIVLSLIHISTCIRDRYGVASGRSPCACSR